MSIDYCLFLDAPDFIGSVMPRLNSVDGVNLRAEKESTILGLCAVELHKMDERHREIMRDDFGTYGLDLNWVITGTADKSTDLTTLMARLIQCSAAIVNQDSTRNMSLMQPATDRIYVHNSARQLTISPIYLDDVPDIAELFDRPYVVDTMESR